jgi:hypothetical protein
MTSRLKLTLLLLGSFVAVLVIMQVVLGQLILSGRTDLVKAHQHSGYTTVLMALLYIALSLRTIAGLPTTSTTTRSKTT